MFLILFKQQNNYYHKTFDQKKRKSIFQNTKQPKPKTQNPNIKNQNSKHKSKIQNPKPTL